MSDYDFVRVLPTATVIDRGGLTSLPPDKLTAFLTDVGAGVLGSVRVVDNARRFFTRESLEQAILANDIEMINLILENRQTTADTTAIARVKAFHSARESLLKLFDSNSPPIPPYPFADVPEGWSVLNNLSIANRSVKRTGGQNTGYSIGVKTLENLWKVASKHWATGEGRARRAMHIRASGYERHADLYQNQIEIGCQTIQRYELEQLALTLGWAFPDRF